jgi:hypothetical protein
MTRMGPETMRAIVHRRYGGPEVLALAEVDRTYPLEQTGEAMAYLESGQVQGKVVIVVADRTPPTWRIPT